MITLSYITVAPLLAARKEGRVSARASLDLGLTESEVALDAEGVAFPDGQRLPWAAVEEIAASVTTCFSVEDGAAQKVQAYSARHGRFYSLLPTRRAPTMLLSGIPMHRIKKVDPHEDTRLKMRTIAPVVGRALDTCTGLGYTAVAAAQTAQEVVTIELDPTVLEVARRNPWSQRLFDSPNIRQIVGSAFEEVTEFEDGAFARIFHDPPTFKIAGDLYSGEMYRQLYRVLARGGRLYHYIGDLDSRTGATVARGAMRRLQEAGFSRVTRRPEAFGLAANK